MKRHSLISTPLFLSLALISTLAGCAKDRTLDDYREQKVAQEVGEKQQAVGVYNGVATSQQDGSVLAAMSLELSTQIDADRSTDRTTTTGNANLVGTLTYYGKSKAKIAFRDVYFDSKSGAIKANTQVKVGNSNLEIEATIDKAGNLTGIIKSLDSSEYGANLSLLRNGPMPEGANLEGKTGDQTPAERFNGLYAATSKFPNGRKMNVEMLLTSTESTAEEEFLSLLNSAEMVDVAIDIDRLAQYRLSNVRWDRRNQTLRAEATLTNDPSTKGILDCRILESGAWNCSLSTSAQGTVFKNITLAPTKGDPKQGRSRPLPKSELYAVDTNWPNEPNAKVRVEFSIVYFNTPGLNPGDAVPITAKASLALRTQASEQNYMFDSIRWDRQTGRLTGQTVKSTATNSTTIQLDCLELALDAWNCTIYSSARGYLFEDLALTQVQ